MGKSSPYQSTIDRVASTLIHPDIDFRNLKRDTDDYFHVLLSISDMEAQSPTTSRDPVFLPSGKSIGPFWAAMCIQDMVRTKRFVRGLYLAIQSALKTFPNQPIHVLYAGTGPFATLALPVTTRFSPEQVQFTFLEINPAAYTLLQKTIDVLNIHAYVKESALTDATTYHPISPVHILLTETMQRALDHEPQVEITQHLVPFLHPEGILLPQSIRVFAGLLNPSKEMIRMQDVEHGPESYIRFLKMILELNRTSALSLSNGFPKIELNIHPADLDGYTQLNLFTSVTVFEKETLVAWESGVTLPKHVMQLDPSQQARVKFEFQYLKGQNPGVQIRLVE